jgi:hypothetical protein
VHNLVLRQRRLIEAVVTRLDTEAIEEVRKSLVL